MSAPPTSAPAATPYKRTSVFDENTLPTGLRRERRTKPCVWGIIRVFEDRLRYQVLDPASEVILEPSHLGLVLPSELHRVEPLGPMRMQIEFYNSVARLIATTVRPFGLTGHSDRLPVTVELMIFVISAQRQARQIINEFNRCDPIHHLKPELISQRNCNGAPCR